MILCFPPAPIVMAMASLIYMTMTTTTAFWMPTRVTDSSTPIRWHRTLGLDSDDDGCIDAYDGDDTTRWVNQSSSINSDGSWGGDVSADGVPEFWSWVLSVLHRAWLSQDATQQDSDCQVTQTPMAIASKTLIWMRQRRHP